MQADAAYCGDTWLLKGMEQWSPSSGLGVSVFVCQTVSPWVAYSIDNAFLLIILAVLSSWPVCGKVCVCETLYMDGVGRKMAGTHYTL